MTTYDNSYSRFVAWVKIVLPLLALGILSTMFLFSQSTDPTLTIPYADVDVEQIARDQTVKNPTYAGITEDGSAISVTAKLARPNLNNPDQFSADELVAQMDLTDGGRVDITSNSGQIDNATDEVLLTGNVHIDTSTGYSMKTQALATSLKTARVRSMGQVDASGPLGELTAGQMEITQPNGADYLLVFNNGVKLVYTP